MVPSAQQELFFPDLSRKGKQKNNISDAQMLLSYRAAGTIFTVYCAEGLIIL
jgi:hypothetical protein